MMMKLTQHKHKLYTTNKKQQVAASMCTPGTPESLQVCARARAVAAFCFSVVPPPLQQRSQHHSQ
jgi:dihydrodipicolinate synthase/N-acetylneuraminate lyase